MNISYISESFTSNFRTAAIGLIFVIQIIFLFTSKSIQSERQKNTPEDTDSSHKNSLPKF